MGVLDGFAVTTDAYWRLLEEQGLREKLEQIFSKLDPENLDQLATAGHAARSIILETPLPHGLRLAVLSAYKELVQGLGREPELAVRSSASAVNSCSSHGSTGDFLGCFTRHAQSRISIVTSDSSHRPYSRNSSG